MIEICTHVYAGTLPQYAVFLRAQLSSLVIWKPKIRTQITVCYSPEDDATFKVLEDFQEPLKYTLKTVRVDKTRLFRRAIFRNYVALNTHADVVWFTDVDHIFGPGCLDDLWHSWVMLFQTYPQKLVYPDSLMIQKSHQVGDAFWRSHEKENGLLIRLNAGEFVRKNYNRPIGGVQIVDGNFARQHGYLNKHKKWQTPVSAKKPFPSFRDDVAFRRFCEDNGGTRSFHLEGLYRLRHTETTYQ